METTKTLTTEDLKDIVSYVYRNNPTYLKGRCERLVDAGIVRVEWGKRVEECLEHPLYYDTARAILDIAVTSFAKESL